jgi:hypothetical protein
MSPAARAYSMTLETRGRGRPRRRLIEGVTDNLRLHNITANLATENALSRKLTNGQGLQALTAKCRSRTIEKKDD